MTAWQYGTAGDRFPIARGETWVVGPHRFTVADVEDPADDLAGWVGQQGGCQMVYTDLPYNAGLARGYRTKAGVDGGQGRPVDYAEFVGAVIDAATEHLLAGWLHIETGRGSVGVVTAVAEASGWPLAMLTKITYGRTNPAVLLSFSRADLPEFGPSLDGTDDVDLPGLLIERHTNPGDRVFDPCAGRGLTPLSAAERGRVALASDLHPRRIAVALGKVSAAEGDEPYRVSGSRT